MRQFTLLSLATLVTTIAVPVLAHAQATTEQYLAREGRTYQGNYASLESQGMQGQYGTWVNTPVAGTSRNGTRVAQPYRFYRYGNDTVLGGSGSYQQGSSTRGGLNSMAGNYSFGSRVSMGRTN